MAQKLTLSIRVSRETLEALKAIGKKGETYDAIIKRLIDAWNRQVKEGKLVEP
jgi:predicted DNA-binding protein